MTFKPMLASPADLDKVVFPVYGSPKLDGIRAAVVEGKLLSRSLKPIPNKFIYAQLSQAKLTGLDGELIVGSPTAKNVFNKTTSAVRRYDDEPEVMYCVFDLHDLKLDYCDRLMAMRNRVETAQVLAPGVKIQMLPQSLLRSRAELDSFEAMMVDLGYEGVILRSMDSPYKHGRSTAREGYLLKVKRFEDSEAIILSVEEEMFNGNEATTNELGRTKRSSHTAGKTGKDRMGKLHVRDVTTGVEFRVGTGFDDEERLMFWGRPEHYIGQLIKYKFFPVGVKDLPRHPVYLGLRSSIDL